MGNLRLCCMFEWKFRYKIDFDFKKNMKYNKVKSKIGYYLNVFWVCKNFFKILFIQKIKIF